MKMKQNSPPTVFKNVGFQMALRRLPKEKGGQGCTRPTHIVAENQIDQTALLALTPRETAQMNQQGMFQYLPDFINTQVSKL